MNDPYTREDFNRRRLAAKHAVRRDSIIVAVVSVSLGLASLGFLKWIDTVFSDTQRIAVSLVTLALFLGIVGWLLVRMKRTARQVAVPCPQCSKPLYGDAERITAATGKCEECGGVVIVE